MLARARRRRYLVPDVTESTPPRDPLAHGERLIQHLMTLASLEDDALAEGPQVIWELEPDARVLDHSSLAEPPGPETARRQAAFPNAVPWASIASADVCARQSAFPSGIGIEDHRLDPVVRALEMPGRQSVDFRPRGLH